MAVKTQLDDGRFLLTKDQLPAVHAKAWQKLLEFSGGTTHLAKMLNMSHQSIRHWNNAQRISTQGARLVSAHPTLGKHFSVKDLRPEMK